MIIYKIQNKINGKIYIGLTTKKNPMRRIYEHLSTRKTHKNSVIHFALVRYGIQNFNIEFIDSAFTKEGLTEKEKYWIHFYNSCNRKTGYNLTNGGEGCRTSRGVVVSDETRRKMALSKLGKKMHITPHTEETKLRMSANAKGKTSLYNISKQKSVLCIDDEIIHPSIEACAKYYGVRSQNVLKVCKGIRKSTGNMRFEFFNGS